MGEDGQEGCQQRPASKCVAILWIPVRPDLWPLSARRCRRVSEAALAHVATGAQTAPLGTASASARLKRQKAAMEVGAAAAATAGGVGIGWVHAVGQLGGSRPEVSTYMGGVGGAGPKLEGETL